MWGRGQGLGQRQPEVAGPNATDAQGWGDDNPRALLRDQVPVVSEPSAKSGGNTHHDRGQEASEVIEEARLQGGGRVLDRGDRINDSQAKEPMALAPVEGGRQIGGRLWRLQSHIDSTR